MNRKCHITVIRVDGETYIRCLLDGTIIKVKKGATLEICPNCKRPIRISENLLNPKTRIMKQVFLPTFFNKWIDIKEI